MTTAYAAVPRLWPESTIVCIGGGPSLTREDVEACRGRARVLAVNDAGFRIAPFADVLYGADAKWWAWHEGCPAFRGLKYTIAPKAAADWPDVQLLRVTGEEGLESDPTGVRTGGNDGTQRPGLMVGGNSGYQAVNVAVHLGARRVLLLGYDMEAPPRGNRQPAHWWGDHPDGTRPAVEKMRLYMPGLVEPLRALGIEVVNCSRRTALTCFPRLTIQEALR